MGWADKIRTLKVRTNADTPYDAENAIKMGAEGIGLCRTEHMFFDTEERRLAIQEMIVAETLEARKTALAKLLPFQRDDFIGIFTAMDGKPVTIRLIDPPLHEFTPKDDAGVEQAQPDHRHRAGEDQAPLRAAPRVQPHARPPRLPPVHHLSRDPGHAGDGDHRGRRRSAPRKGIKVFPEIMHPADDRQEGAEHP